MIASSSLSPLWGTAVDEVELLRDLILSAVKIATHLRPDLDALFAVWGCQRVRLAAGLEPVEVLFIPAGLQGIEEGILAVDVGHGRGIQKFGEGHSIKLSALGGSAAMAVFRALPETDRNALESLVKGISYADEKGENIHTQTLKRTGFWGRLDIRNQILMSNDWKTHTALLQKLSDRRLLEWWSAKYDGLVLIGMDKKLAREAAEKATYLFKRQLAILPFKAPKETSQEAYKRGARLVLYSSELGGDRWALGLARNPEPPDNVFDLNVLRTTLEKNFPGIWVHPTGLMAGWPVKNPLNCTRQEYDVKRRRFVDVVVQGLIEVLGDPDEPVDGLVTTPAGSRVDG